MSRSPRILRELYETLCIMGGDRDHNTTLYSESQPSALQEHISHYEDCPISFPSHKSNAEHRAARDEAIRKRLNKRPAKEHAVRSQKASRIA